MEKAVFLELTEKIIKSKGFGRSTTYANLLRFLVRSSLDEDAPKETIIAAEVFGKPDFDPSESTLIRVYVYKLREKLRNYYAGEGSGDPYRLRIPKGSYGIVFEKAKHQSGILRLLQQKTVRLGLMGGTLACLLLLAWFQLGRGEDGSLRESIWSDLVSNGFPTAVFLGDLFIYLEEDSLAGMSRTIRDPDINGLSDFASFRKDDHREGVQTTALSYGLLVRGSLQWIKDLTRLFDAAGHFFSIRTISRFNPKELQDQNFVVVGMIKTLGLFTDYFNYSRFAYDEAGEALILEKGDAAERQVFTPTGDPDGYHTDYGFMAKFPGPNQNTVYLFCGLWDTGATQSLKNFTDTSLRQAIESEIAGQLGEVPRYFEVLFEVSGIDRTELSTKLIHVFPLEEPATFWVDPGGDTLNR
ncbi:hypothetical protein [Cyclobacterium plantarum]|uniref:OmpR/PhoB-type domain-containing protein n=1 Tax=Cyclobacterium plantarum TaxID=2716263 RepID=A0ABX0HA03_9BACT|nr:hypothetical protein [Cyclobacterium plantarum]NHE57169.1 hypothetical protein [Cyclobacterium plantarum]